jgi:expansin (peptidoglycan-binding protein)
MTPEFITDCLVIMSGAAVAWAFWRVSRPKPVFSVRVVDGKPQAVEGTVAPAFLARVRELAAKHDLSQGAIDGFVHGRFIRLRFSSQVPDEARQSLRNWWATFGWSPPRMEQPGRCS